MTAPPGNRTPAVDRTLDEIAEMLRARMRDLPAAWGLDGRIDGNDFLCLSPFRADKHAGSFRICVKGSHRGLIRDFASGQTWSALRLTADLMFGGDMKSAVTWAKRWLGIDGGDPNDLQRTRLAITRAAEEDDRVDEQELAKRRNAQAIYLHAKEGIIGPDNPVFLYLYGRGIDLTRLPFAKRWLRALRYHPELRYGGRDGPVMPGMVAPIVADDGTFLAVHRTWLAADPDLQWGWRKAGPAEGVAEPKRSYGRFAGRNGLIRLWGGARVDADTGQITRRPKWRDMKPGETIHITEGIEDAMTVATLLPQERVAAGISLDNMRMLRWPPAIDRVVIWRQNDAPGSAAAQGVVDMVERYRQQGVTVVLPTPPEGIKDVNELVCRLTSQPGEPMPGEPMPGELMAGMRVTA